jgi:16S rRNA (guanine527-N7)-methyltransferase
MPSSGGSARPLTLASLLEAEGVEPRLIPRLARYGDVLLDANRKFNLTGAKTAQALCAHIVDSLSIVQYVRDPHVDIGSGGGFPAIPIAIACGVRVTMVESTRKKARFLREVLDRFGIAGEVVAERAETAAHEERLRERFGSGTARAVALAPTVAELLLPFIAVGGIAILQRGAVEPRERTALEDAALMLGARIDAEHLVSGESRVFLLHKTLPSSKRFPRRTGIPEKRPLCMSHSSSPRGT